MEASFHANILSSNKAPFKLFMDELEATRKFPERACAISNQVKHDNKYTMFDFYKF